MIASRFIAARRTVAPPWALVFGLMVAAVCLVPPVYLVVRAGQSMETVSEVLAARSTLELAVRSIALSGLVTAFAIAVALPLGWLVERTDLPGRRTLGVLVALPLAVPSYVGALVFISALGPRGLLQQALEPLGVDRLPSIYGWPGAVVVLGVFTYPYVLLTLRPALQGLDPRIEELSASFGHGRWTTFRRVILPQLRPALLSGGLLVALYTLADFGAVALLRFDSLTRAIFISYQASFDRSRAAVLALVLAAIALTVVVLEVWSRAGRRHDAVRGSGRAAARITLGRWRWPALAFVGLVIALGVAMPIGVLGYWLVRGLAAGEATRGIGAAVTGSLVAAGLAALVTAVAALPVAVLAVRHRGHALSRAVEVASYTGYALPGLIVALALVFVSIRLGPLYQSLWLLVAGYALLFLPQAVAATRVALGQIRPSMEEAARGLGRPAWQVTATVTVPLASRGIAAGAALVFLTTMKELPATLLLSPTGYETLATRVWGASTEAFFTRAALPAIVLVILSTLPLLLLSPQVTRRRWLRRWWRA
ncbi:MAG: iron ABC transporter permease [Dehalococcoidia bacterium]